MVVLFRDGMFATQLLQLKKQMSVTFSVVSNWSSVVLYVNV